MVIILEHQYELGRPSNEQKRYLIIESFEVYKQKLLNNTICSFNKYAFQHIISIKEGDGKIKINYVFHEKYPYEFIHVGSIINYRDFNFDKDIILDTINKKYIHSEEELNESLH